MASCLWRIPPLSAEGGIDDGFDGVHAVLRLVEHNGLGGLEDLVCDLHLGDAELFRDLRADGGLCVVEGGEAMHEDRGGLGVPHGGGVDLVGPQQPDALLPYRLRLAHGDPDVGVDHVGPPGPLVHILGEADGAVVLPGDGLGLLHQLGGGEELPGGAGGEMDAHFGAQSAVTERLSCRQF